MKGHWFCETCNDVVNMSAPVGRWDSLRDVLCPVCRHQTAFWVKDIPPQPQGRNLTPAEASEHFAKLRAEFNPGDVI